MGLAHLSFEIRSFVVLVSYYRQFVEGFSTFAAPLTWLIHVEAGFLRLNVLLTTSPLLTLQVEGDGFSICCDAPGVILVVY